MTTPNDDFDFMASIPEIGDDREIWVCEGAIAEVRCYRDEEAETDEDRAAAQRGIDQLAARLRRLEVEVRG